MRIMYVELNFSRESGARKTYSVLGRHKKDSYVMAARKEQVSSFRFGMITRQGKTFPMCKVQKKRYRRTCAKGPNSQSSSWFHQHEACLGVLLFPSGWDASLSQGYPLKVCHHYLFIHLGEERQSGLKFLVFRRKQGDG